MYHKRFWKRLATEATPWARDNIFWGIAVLLIPPLVVWLRNPKVTLDWQTIKLTLILYGITINIHASAVHASPAPTLCLGFVPIMQDKKKRRCGQSRHEYMENASPRMVLSHAPDSTPPTPPRLYTPFPRMITSLLSPR